MIGMCLAFPLIFFSTIHEFTSPVFLLRSHRVDPRGGGRYVGVRAGRVCELERSSRSKFKLFGTSSAQFSSLVTSLCVKFVQFSSGHRGL